MDNFFDDLKNNLDHRPEPEFEESAWLAMQEKMQPQKEPKRYVDAWWLSWLLLPLIFASSYFYFQMEKAETTINEMKVQILRDTIYTTRTIFVRDTIFQNDPTIVSESTNSSAQFISSNPLTPFSQSPFFNKNYSTNNFAYFNNISSADAGVLNSPNPSWLLATRINSNVDSNNESSSDDTKETFSSNLKVALLSSLEIGLVEPNQQFPIELNLQEVVILKKNNWRKRWVQITNTMRPKSFHLGFGVGYIYPTNENLSNRSGYALNLQGVVGFNKNLRMWLDFSYQQLHLEADNLEEEFGIPNIPLPNDDYTFEKATTDQPLLQYSVGMQYLFNTNKKVRPYLGIGFSIISPQPYEVEYEYEDLAENEIIIPKDYSTQGIQSNQWILNAGMEYQFGKKWSGQLEGFYRASWEGENNITPNILGINTRLLYKF